MRNTNPGAAQSLRAMMLDIVDATQQLTGARVTLQDTSGFLHESGLLQPEDTMLRHHDCQFCQYVRDLPGGRARCVHSDLEEGLRQAQEAERPVWRCCHAGVWELVAPVFYEGKVVTLFFLGQARVEGREAPLNLSELRMLGAEDVQAQAQYRSLPQADGVQMERGALLMQLALQELLRKFPRAALEEYFLRSEYSLANRAVHQLRSQIEQGANVQTLAAMLYVSPASLRRAFVTELGISLKEYAASARLALACRLLREGRQSVATVGTNVGFQDVSTFLRWFRRQTGRTPTSYCAEQGGRRAREMPVSRGGVNYVAAAQAYLMENFRGEVRVAVLAEKLGITPDHLTRLYRQAMGVTVTQALTRLRIETARGELSGGNAPLSWIARQTGFSSTAMLKVRFRDVYGISPEEYRRENQTKGEKNDDGV